MNTLGIALLAGLAGSTLAVTLYGAAAAPTEHGLDLAEMDRSVRPGDDFFAFADGNWVKTTPIPADRSSYSSFAILAEQASRRTADLIREAGSKPGGAGPEAAMVGDYYAAFMDEKGIEARGASPLKPELDAIAAIADPTALARYLGGELRADVDPLNNTNFHTDRLFGLWVSPDFDDPARNEAYLLQGGLGMPDRDYYLGTAERDRDLQARYRAHIAAVFTLGGFGDAAARAARVYELELLIAKTHVSRADSLEVEKAHNRWPLSSFAERAPGLDWQAYFAAAGLAAQKDVMVWHPSATVGIAALVASQPLATWKDYLVFHALDRGSPFLSRPFVDEHFAFYGKALTGAVEQRERWKRAVDRTNDALGEMVGKLYVARYFPPQAKATAEAMVRNIIEAFRHRIDALAWMTPATRAKAKAKLDTLYVGIGYPDTWRDYKGLVVKRDDAFGNRERSELFDYRAALADLGRPVDPKRWRMTPQTVNAVNLPLQNALNFPAAILDRPFFDAATDAAQNYGGIGVVIGHEISHSFDDQGSLFDAQGRLANWWTPEDFAHFRAAADRLAKQYDAYEPLPGEHINGKLTLSENLADVAGLAAAFDGYRAANGGKEGPAAQGWSGDQRFFLSFAQIWRSAYRPQALHASLLTNGHAPGQYRVYTVRNLDAWYRAFDVQPGAKLYLAPAGRVLIW